MKDGNLELSDHGRRFSANMTVVNKFAEGKICYENGRFYLCQNVCSGRASLNKLGYLCGFDLGDGKEWNFSHWKIENFKFINMTAKEIEEYKDFKKGDSLRNKRGELSIIVEQLGVVLFVKKYDIYNSVYCYLEQELYNRGWRLDVTPEEEILPVIEMTVAEAAKKMGMDPKQLKIVDK